jgi:TolA-binding protein
MTTTVTAPRRSQRVLIVVLAVLFLVAAAVAGSLYVQTADQSGTISSKDSSLSSLQSGSGSQSAAIASLEGNLSALSTEISSLNGQISSLQGGSSASQTEIHSLQTQASQLQNESALLKQEITLLGQVGGEEVSPIGVDFTYTVQPNSTVLVVQQLNRYNGSLVFNGYTCPDGAGTQSNADGSSGVTVLLNDKSFIPSSSQDIATITSASGGWAFYLRNIGPTTVQCTGSLFFVYHVPPAYP